MSAATGKILVIRGGAIGDFVLTLPVLTALRDQFPGVHLEVLGYEHIAGLASLGGLANAVRSIESGALAAYFARDGTLSAEWQDYFAGFAIIVSYLYDPDLIFQTNVARSSKAQFIAGPHRPDDAAHVPASVVFLKPLERLAIFGADARPRLRLSRAPGGRVSGAATSSRASVFTLALHPGSGSELKNWPIQDWSNLLEHLVGETNWHLLMVGGEAELPRLHQLTGRLPLGRFDLLRNLPLTHLAERLSSADAFVGHDSGISHLAAAVGLPGVVLWGGSAESVWRPPSERVHILRHPSGLTGITVSCVIERLKSLALE